VSDGADGTKTCQENAEPAYHIVRVFEACAPAKGGLHVNCRAGPPGFDNSILRRELRPSRLTKIIGAPQASSRRQGASLAVFYSGANTDGLQRPIPGPDVTFYVGESPAAPHDLRKADVIEKHGRGRGVVWRLLPPHPREPT
jgi:hypothetical protein